MNNLNDEKWLEPLRNRPDLEPNPVFAKELKASLLEGRYKNTGNRGWLLRFRVLVPALMAILLFSVITVSFLSNDMPNQGEVPTETVKTPDDSNEVNPNFDALIAENTAYKTLYDEVFEQTKVEEASKTVVYFFEALRVKDQKYLENRVFFAANPEKEIPVLLEFYEGFDENSLKLEYVVRSLGEQSYEIVFTYEQNNQVKTHHIHLDLQDENNFLIYAPLDKFDPEENRKQAINLKAKGIEEMMELGITKEEAVNRFGSAYTEGVNPNFDHDGTVEDWMYHFYGSDNQEGEFTPDIDIGMLKNQQVGVILNIGWSVYGKALRMDLYYGKDGNVFNVTLNEDGFSEYDITPNKDNTSLKDLELTEEEEVLYKEFKKEQNPEVLRNAHPISIAKMYIHAQLDNDIETNYALYTTREDRVLWNLDQQRKDWEKDPPNIVNIIKQLSGLGAGTWNEIDEDEGYIHFRNENGEQWFSMIRDPNGVWKVSFLPIQ
ncbi:hypothetical protein [Fredinandcohnia sp. 179-A 10B2 NHS]|uniref:hypothetical protein n=1 Tax=Fredinandcohnia sp. 179-A 10B2 NHS TaxID=3235176 RepID=UPI0039A161FE